MCYLFLAKSSVESAQVSICTEEVVFRLDITCKIIFVLSFIKIKTLEKGKKNCRVEVDAYCLELLAKAFLNKFLINFRADFDATNNNKLFGSYLSSSYNHVLLEKTSQLYQIRCLTGRNTAAILRIYFKDALFHCLSHS